jgi:hypothetical protein
MFAHLHTHTQASSYKHICMCHMSVVCLGTARTRTPHVGRACAAAPVRFVPIHPFLRVSPFLSLSLSVCATGICWSASGPSKSGAAAVRCRPSWRGRPMRFVLAVAAVAVWPLQGQGPGRPCATSTPSCARRPQPTFQPRTATSAHSSSTRYTRPPLRRRLCLFSFSRVHIFTHTHTNAHTLPEA